MVREKKKEIQKRKRELNSPDGCFKYSVTEMKINGITRKDDKNVAILLENGEKLVIDYEVFLKNGLRKYDELSDEKLSLLADENEKQKIKASAFRLLGRRLHSQNELRQKLIGKKSDRRFVDAVLAELKEKNLIDDPAFARQFAEENVKNKLWGPSKIRSALIKKGISRETIEETLSEYLNSSNDLDNAVVLAEKKIKSLKKRTGDNKKLRAKLFSFLLSRGYDYEVSREAVGKIISSDT
jgi:regulatory protein